MKKCMEQNLRLEFLQFFHNIDDFLMHFHIWKSTTLAKTWRKTMFNLSYLYPLVDETPKPKLSYSPSLLVVSLHKMDKFWPFELFFTVVTSCSLIREFDLCFDNFWSKIMTKFFMGLLNTTFFLFVVTDFDWKWRFTILIRGWNTRPSPTCFWSLDQKYLTYYMIFIIDWASNKKILLHILHSFFSIYMSKSFWLNSILWKKLHIATFLAKISM